MRSLSNITRLQKVFFLIQKYQNGDLSVMHPTGLIFCLAQQDLIHLYQITRNITNLQSVSLDMHLAIRDDLLLLVSGKIRQRSRIIALHLVLQEKIALRWEKIQVDLIILFCLELLSVGQMEMISTPILAQTTLQMKSRSTIMLDSKEPLLDGNATRWDINAGISVDVNKIEKIFL
ncbi:unnamed protein product [Oikopleura dioica]|uniref:Uncharacterized protein n=1 Tax=Oikopleura dioica TaxID=34765 RepID=E4YY93_OIKDI|nr:unnamed protein product [Oikopleura dioica]